MPTLDDVVAGYVRLRDQKKELQSRHKEELAPLNAKMETMEGWLRRELDKQHAESIRTDKGTVFKHVRTSATVRDWESTLNFIRSTQSWDLLERRISKLAVEERAEEGIEVPGVAITRDITVQIRRK